MLDDPAVLGRDSLGLLGVIGDSPAMFDAARTGAEAVAIDYPAEAVANVAVCGMGGSAVAGDLVLGAYRERLRRPAAVVRDYYVPGWVGEDTLVLLSSYSGGTEETLTCGMQALDYRSLIVGVTSGGKLLDWYTEQGVPVVRVPGGLQPRAALLHLLLPVAVVLARMQVIPDIAADLDEARATVAAAVAQYGPEVPYAENPAKQLASLLEGRLPVIWGGEATAAVAMRWKCQLNENAKIPAYWAALPELDHNEICGYAGAGALGPLTHVVTLRDPRQHRQVQRRFQLTAELVEREVKQVTPVTAEGDGPLARMLDLVMLGDYVSLYLALAAGVDPGPVEAIQQLKDRLASTGYGRAQG